MTYGADLCPYHKNKTDDPNRCDEHIYIEENMDGLDCQTKRCNSISDILKFIKTRMKAYIIKFHHDKISYQFGKFL